MKFISQFGFHEMSFTVNDVGKVYTRIVLRTMVHISVGTVFGSVHIYDGVSYHCVL